MWLVAQLPYSCIYRIGQAVGWILYCVPSHRHIVVATNIRLCYPHLDTAAQRRLVRNVFLHSGITLFETGFAWWASSKRVDRLCEVQGFEHVEQAIAAGKGVVLLGAHQTPLEMGGRCLTRLTTCHFFYRPVDNQAYNTVQSKYRYQHCGNIIRKNDPRGIFKSLKQGVCVWYTPDQDMGPKVSVFAPFYGIPAASVTAMSKIARISKAPLVPYFVYRKPNGRGFLLRFAAPLIDYPCGDEVQDATRVNQVLQQGIDQAPEQYLWLHRRFKTRPEGEPDLYPKRPRKKKKKKKNKVKA